MESKNASKIILAAFFVSIIFIDSLVILINSLVKAGIIWKSVEPVVESQEAFGGCSIEWQHNFGESGDDRGWSLRQTNDGGYIITGYADSFGAGGYDVYLMKTTPNGTLEWQKTFGGSEDDGGWSVRQTTDGGYIIAGFTDSFGVGAEDIYLMKTTPNGALEWQQTFGGYDIDDAHSVLQTTDKDYIIAGFKFISNPSDNDVFLLKVGEPMPDMIDK